MLESARVDAWNSLDSRCETSVAGIAVSRFEDDEAAALFMLFDILGARFDGGKVNNAPPATHRSDVPSAKRIHNLVVSRLIQTVAVKPVQ